MEMGDDGSQALSTPETSAAQAVDRTTSRPTCHSVALTGGPSQHMGRPAPPETPAPRRVRPGDE